MKIRLALTLNVSRARGHRRPANRGERDVDMGSYVERAEPRRVGFAIDPTGDPDYPDDHRREVT